MALHALLDSAARWDAAVIVSAHPGLEDESERVCRREADELWARRIEEDPWDELVAAWMAQPVFHGRAGPERREADFDRSKLALAMRALSLGRQELLTERVAELRIPLFWVAGAEDPRYRARSRRSSTFAARNLRKQPLSILVDRRRCGTPGAVGSAAAVSGRGCRICC